MLQHYQKTQDYKRNYRSSFRLFFTLTTIWLLSASLLAQPAPEPSVATSGPGTSETNTPINIRLADHNEFDYLAELLERVLTAEGYAVNIIPVANIPTTRLERMLHEGRLSMMVLGKTPRRRARFLAVDVGMTDGMMSHRLFFIPKGQQLAYRDVETLDQLVATGKTAGMGKAWRDFTIWQKNDLPVFGLDGDWKRLYRMLASGDRGIDYLPRGAHEIAKEWREHPDLEVEQHLVLVYDLDHILYVSPAEPELHETLRRLLPAAKASGLIANLIRKHYPEVFAPPISLQQRRVIPLKLDDPDGVP